MEEQNEEVLYREKLALEYCHKKFEKITDEVWSIDQQIEFYEKNKISLNSLLLDINEYFVDNKSWFYQQRGYEYILTGRQEGCVIRITKTFIDKVYENDIEAFSHAYYELLDFIYYPGTGLVELTFHEIEIVRMMIAYLINKADQYISCLKNHPDEYLGKYSIQKSKETIFRKYYNLVVDNTIVGKGWIAKLMPRFAINGMNIYIKPEFRRKKYATKFYRLLACEMINRNIEWSFYIVDKTNQEAIGFLNQILYRQNRYNRKNKIIFEDVFVEE